MYWPRKPRRERALGQPCRQQSPYEATRYADIAKVSPGRRAHGSDAMHAHALSTHLGLQQRRRIGNIKHLSSVIIHEHRRAYLASPSTASPFVPGLRSARLAPRHRNSEPCWPVCNSAAASKMIPAEEITRTEFDELLAEYDSVLDSVATAKGGTSGLICVFSMGSQPSTAQANRPVTHR